MARNPMPQTSIPKYQYNSMLLCLCPSKHEVGPSTPTIRRDLIPAILNTLFHNLSLDFPTKLIGRCSHVTWFNWSLWLAHKPDITLASQQAKLMISIMSMRPRYQVYPKLCTYDSRYGNIIPGFFCFPTPGPQLVFKDPSFNLLLSALALNLCLLILLFAVKVCYSYSVYLCSLSVYFYVIIF